MFQDSNFADRRAVDAVTPTRFDFLESHTSTVMSSLGSVDFAVGARTDQRHLVKLTRGSARRLGGSLLLVPSPPVVTPATSCQFCGAVEAAVQPTVP